MGLDILLIDDEAELRNALGDALRDADHQVELAADGAEGLEKALGNKRDVVICDVRLPKVDGLTVFQKIRAEFPGTDVILMTAHAEVAEAVSALKQGAFEYLTKPFDVDELLLQLQRIEDHRALRRELEQARVELSGRKPEMTLVGQSPGMRRVLGLIDTVATSDTPVLVTGESGTGKELVARMLSERSFRREKPFVVVNCGALTETLIEAELFGHERGAFTGAVKKRDGRFKAADGGTIFLDEIAELPLSAQAKLLRVLQEGTFEPLGTNTTVKVNVRVISATHRNLRERIAAGMFREDLFYRVNVIELALPPLRDRPGDLVMLVQYFLHRFTPHGGVIPAIGAQAWAALTKYEYPGNIRELAHAIEHAVVLSGGQAIEIGHLPSNVAAAALPLSHGAAVSPAGLADVRPLHLAMREFEREYIAGVMIEARNKRVRAAEILGISRKSLWEKLRLHGLNVEPERRDAAVAVNAPNEIKTS